MFPRNETYAPTNDTLPILIAVQNAAVAQPLNLEIWYDIYDQSADVGSDKPIVRSTQWLKWANLSASEPYFHLSGFSQQYELKATEGRWRLAWAVHWQSCVEDSFTNPRPLGRGVLTNYSRRYVDFVVERGAQQPMDLAAASADGKPCGPEFGVAINVTSQTVAVPPAPQRSGSGWNGNGDTCAVVASSLPQPTANPCRVKVDSAVVESLYASQLAEMCEARPGHCGRSGGSRPLAVAGAAGLAVTFGALGFFLVWI